MSQPQFDWDAEIRMPVAGRTPLARHCSSTGAQAAALMIGSKLEKLLKHFAANPRATLQEFAAANGWQNNAVCSTFDRAKNELNWIEETGDVKRVAWPRSRTTSQAYHRLTAEGRRAWLGAIDARVKTIEAGS